jgi:hypothetical protein
VVIIGDSHARGCAANMKHILENCYEINSVVKPGACSETLITSANDDIQQVTNKD